MNDKFLINEKILDTIPEGDNCVDKNGICPFWKPVTRDGETITRAKCLLKDFEEEEDFQGTFLWGMLKICEYKN
jgi:hypothetical protein